MAAICTGRGVVRPAGKPCGRAGSIFKRCSTGSISLLDFLSTWIRLELCDKQSDHLLGLPLVIHISSIKEVDAKFVGFVYALNGGFFCYRVAIGQPTAQSNRTDAQACAYQSSVLHR